jgi:nucleolar GTP-binding protein
VRFDVPVVTVCNTSAESRDVEADHYMSVTEDESVEAVLRAAVEAVDHEAELPYEG